MPTDQPDGSDLRERVADLEATVSDQQETIQQLMPSRRQAIAGMGLLGGGLLGGRLSTGTARAQAAGQQGTADEPNDMFAWDLDVQNGVTSDLPMGGNDVTGVGALDVEDISIGNLRERWQLDSTVSVPHDTFVVIPFDSKAGFDDELGSFDTDDKWYPNTDGKYEFKYQVSYVPISAGGELRADIGADTEPPQGRYTWAEAGESSTVEISGEADLSESDGVEFLTRQRSGSSQTVDDSEIWTQLRIKRIG